MRFREVLRATSGDTPAFDPRPLAQELYQILVGPVARDLEGAQRPDPHVGAGWRLALPAGGGLT